MVFLEELGATGNKVCCCLVPSAFCLLLLLFACSYPLKRTCCLMHPVLSHCASASGMLLHLKAYTRRIYTYDPVCCHALSKSGSSCCTALSIFGIKLLEMRPWLVCSLKQRCCASCLLHALISSICSLASIVCAIAVLLLNSFMQWVNILELMVFTAALVFHIC